MEVPTHAQLTIPDLQEFLHFLLNVQVSHPSRRIPACCIWGPPGIGKTAIVQQFAKDHHLPYVELQLAQFEEMGDLLGMPYRLEGHTYLAPPEWVPTKTGPGLLFLDDINRADHRILNGLMPLFLDGGLASWRLPPGWIILASANPDDGTHAVTPLDPALASRFQHVTLVNTLAHWISWARNEKLPERVLSYISTHPALFQTGSSPRSLTAFATLLASLPEGQDSLLTTLVRIHLPRDHQELFLAWCKLKHPSGWTWEGVREQPAIATALAELNSNLDPRLTATLLQHILLEALTDITQDGSPLSGHSADNLIAILQHVAVAPHQVMAFLQEIPADHPLQERAARDLRQKLL